MTVHYARGDATRPQGEEPKIIAHICNDIGRWGKGFVLALSKRWKEPELAYKQWFHEGRSFELGRVQFVPVSADISVANMIAQHRVAVKGEVGPPPIRYDALEQALSQVADQAINLRASVHMPRIGCGVAGGRWEEVEPIILRQLCKRNIAVTVYDLE
jgi:O-acetyl-ADP-ribose deacetylase (regulator of RNase III)